MTLPPPAPAPPLTPPRSRTLARDPDQTRAPLQVATRAVVQTRRDPFVDAGSRPVGVARRQRGGYERRGRRLHRSEAADQSAGSGHDGEEAEDVDSKHAIKRHERHPDQRNEDCSATTLLSTRIADPARSTRVRYGLVSEVAYVKGPPTCNS